MNFLKGIGRIAKSVSPFLAMSGVGTPLALGIGAGGGALEAAADDDRDTGVLGGMVKGAVPAVAGKALGSLASRVMPAAAPAISNPSQAIAAGSMGGPAAAAAPAAAGRGLGGRLLDWAKANPELAMSAAGTGVEAFGAYQEGQAMDRLADIRERELDRDNMREDNLDEVLAQITRRLTAPRMG